MKTYLDLLHVVAQEDVNGLQEAEKSYKDSWKKRGGIGAYMMLARKWDRIEAQVERHGWDVFKAIQEDNRPEGIIDDIQDLRRYLNLVESEMRVRNISETEPS